MYDNDDIRSNQNDREPWELDTSSRFRQHFDSRRVEDLGKKYRERAEERREAQIRKAEEAKQARDARHDRNRFQQTENDDGGTPPPPETHDPRGDRYDYGDGRRATVGAPQRRRGSGLSGVLVIVVVAVICVCLISGGDALLGSFSLWDDADYDDYGGYDDYDDYDDGSDWYGDDDFGVTVPYGDEDEDDGTDDSTDTGIAAEEDELERAELDETLSATLQTSVGLEALSYQEIYAKCLPSVVSITVITAEGTGTGTGIVMTADGYILTCNHVIEDGITCTVTTYDDQVYTALLVGGDAQTDLAVLKIEADGLTPAEFGDSDELTVGDEALAIGDPLGTTLRGTLTNGIISAINRNVTVNGYSMTLLQTTAALNSGNSGGPLINIYGQVVGVNNMKMNSTSVTVEGLGFAVPTSVVKEIVPTLATEGKVSRPVLGITCYSISEEYVESGDYLSSGCLVASVNELSDAYAQGIQVGDYITQINGMTVTSVDDVKAVIEDMSIGDTVELTILRPNEEGTAIAEELTITVALVDQANIS
ncbi:MAG: S1C family serine protease [Clostridiales bacterium]|nr:S1C family serine protease [Clostridiales bacterium]